ncbi:hypothetical protein D5086_016435 [Populus alba]|uniref:Uncharacterized protein n=2 Tax=Populus alba TaxID=43335 RepID=A0ACC4BTY3_POPAL|nr:glycosyl hydrolase family 38 family protein [Populus alba]
MVGGDECEEYGDQVDIVDPGGDDFEDPNEHAEGSTEAHFGTLDEYFRTLRGKADRINYSLPVEAGSDQIGGFFNLYQFESEQVRSKYDVQPVFKAIDAREGTSQYVEFSNPLEQNREEIANALLLTCRCY